MIDPSAITLVQAAFLQHITEAVTTITDYALKLLYLFATLEVIILGFLWALDRNLDWGSMILKILQIGLVFFVIQNSTWIFGTVIKSFAQMGGVVANNKDLAKFIFNPAQIWQYGYDFSLSLLHAATLGSSFGLILLEVILGMGILLTFGLIGIEIVLQVVGFYLIALTALILLPFGIFSPASDMLVRPMQNVFKAGGRVMVLIMIIGIAVFVFNSFPPTDFSDSNNLAYNINQPLGLFFTALLFLCLSWRLPRLVVDSIGRLKIVSSVDKNIVTTISQQNPESLTALQVATGFDTRETVQSTTLETGEPIDSEANFADVDSSPTKSESDKWRDLLRLDQKDIERQSISPATLKKRQKM